MGKARKTRKFAAVKRMLAPSDARVQTAEDVKKRQERERARRVKEGEEVRHVEKVDPSLFFRYNTALVPPYQVLIDTNFINLAIQNKLDVVRACMDCLLAKCTVCVTDCVVAELEKLGHRYRIALRMTKDPRFERLPCTHKGTYADDCLVARVKQHRCYVVGTCDRELKRRLRKVPGVPIMSIAHRKCYVERMPGSEVYRG